MKEALKLALEMVQNKMYAHAEMYLQETLAQPEQPAQPELGETPLTQDEFDRWFDALPWHLRARWPTQPAPVQQEPIEMYKKKCADGSRCLHGCHTNEPCYTTPPQPEQEPVAKYSDIVSDGGLDPRNKFDIPPQRKPLTDKELNIIGSRWHLNLLVANEKAEVFAFARDVEAAHGIKENT